MPDVKTKKNEASVSDFLAGIADESKRRDCHTILKMMREATGEEAKMWGTSIVGFGSYHYRYESGREGDFMLTGFSPRKQNLTLYIMPGFSRFDGLMAKLGKHKTGKSCLYIKRLADVDENVLRQLVVDSVAHMKAKYGQGP